MTAPRARTGILLAALASLAFGVPSAWAEGADRASFGRRLVAVGDVHGAIGPLRTILRETKLVDEDDRWIGRDAILVQTGDFLDRGAGTYQVIELLRSLQEQAPRHGGEVMVLMGNHEAINLLRDMRYVDADLLAPWADRRSEKRRKRHCTQALDHAHRLADRMQTEPPERGAFEADCLERTHPGLLEYLDELMPDADLGRWLRSLPAVVRVGDVLFLHGGLTEETAQLEVDEINALVTEQIGAFDRVRNWLLSRNLVLPTVEAVEVAAAARQVLEALEGGTKIYDAPDVADLEAFRSLDEWFLVDPEGPLWFRGYAQWTDSEGAMRIRRILELAGVRAAVAGHTPQKTGSIQERWDRRVFLIDTGMLASHYDGVPSALEFADGQVRAVYPGVREIFGDFP